MTLKNRLKTKKAQSTVEYILLFAIIAVLTLISVTKALPRLQTAGQDYFNKAVNALD